LFRTMNPRDLLPLRPLFLSVLLAVREDPQHGYDVLERVNQDQGEYAILGPGSLYRTLKEMRDLGLIERRPMPAGVKDGRRAYHAITDAGRSVLRLEVDRLQQAMTRAGVGLVPERTA